MPPLVTMLDLPLKWGGLQMTLTNFSLSTLHKGVSCADVPGQKGWLRTGASGNVHIADGNLDPLLRGMYWKYTLSSWQVMCYIKHMECNAMRPSALKCILYLQQWFVCYIRVMCASVTPVQNRHSLYQCIHLKIYMYSTADIDLQYA